MTFADLGKLRGRRLPTYQAVVVAFRDLKMSHETIAVAYRLTLRQVSQVLRKASRNRRTMRD